MTETIIRMMGYIELYAPDPAVHLPFSTPLGHITITHEKEIKKITPGGWSLRVGPGEPYSFQKKEIARALAAAGIPPESFAQQLRVTTLTFAAVALIGVDDLARAVGMPAIIAAKRDWSAFMDSLVATAETARSPSMVPSGEDGQQHGRRKIIPLRR
jgi:hypothetical protein